jgi:hypothetical protein
MIRSMGGATLVVSATLPRQFRAAACQAWLRDEARTAVPVTWEAGIETLASVAESIGRTGADPRLAVALAPAWLDSRQELRRRIAEARRAVPGLDAAVLRGPRPLELQALIAEEGIRTVLVETFGEGARGSRRPAPAGWACRNPVWGLWEVKIATPRRQGLLRWLPWGSMRRPRAGSLHVMHAGDVPAENPLGGRLDRLIAWAERRQCGGAATAVALQDLPAILARSGQAPGTSSILKAA